MDHVYSFLAANHSLFVPARLPFFHFHILCIFNLYLSRFFFFFLRYPPFLFLLGSPHSYSLHLSFVPFHTLHSFQLSLSLLDISHSTHSLELSPTPPFRVIDTLLEYRLHEHPTNFFSPRTWGTPHPQPHSTPSRLLLHLLHFLLSPLFTNTSYTPECGFTPLWPLFWLWPVWYLPSQQAVNPPLLLLSPLPSQLLGCQQAHHQLASPPLTAWKRYIPNKCSHSCSKVFSFSWHLAMNGSIIFCWPNSWLSLIYLIHFSRVWTAVSAVWTTSASVCQALEASTVVSCLAVRPSSRSRNVLQSILVQVVQLVITDTAGSTAMVC